MWTWGKASCKLRISWRGSCDDLFTKLVLIPRTNNWSKNNYQLWQPDCLASQNISFSNSDVGILSKNCSYANNKALLIHHHSSDFPRKPFLVIKKDINIYLNLLLATGLMFPRAHEYYLFCGKWQIGPILYYGRNYMSTHSHFIIYLGTFLVLTFWQLPMTIYIPTQEHQFKKEICFFCLNFNYLFYCANLCYWIY